MMAICEHTEVPRHVKAWRRHEGTQPGEELVRAHVGPGRLGAAAVNGDGRLDLWVGDGQTIDLYLADDDGYARATTFDPQTFTPIGGADFNDDGVLELWGYGAEADIVVRL